MVQKKFYVNKFLSLKWIPGIWLVEKDIWYMIKNHFIFDPVQKRDQLKFYRLSDASFPNNFETPKRTVL